MSEIVIFYYADFFGANGELTGRSPTLSTLDDAKAFVGQAESADIFRVESYCYSWESNNCFNKSLAGRRRPEPKRIVTQVDIPT